MICSKCGTSNSLENRFCLKCGDNLLTQNNAKTENNDSVGNQPIQQDLQNQQSINSKDINEDKKHYDFKKIAIIGVPVILLIIGITVGFKFIFGNKANDNLNDILASNAFFLKNSENKYALFNEEGKKVTDFIFSKTEELINNVAKVENANKEVGIISSNGKMIVDFGKYETISQSLSLFLVKDKNNKTFLLDATGKVLKEFDKASVTSYGNTTPIVVLKANEEYSVLNYLGDILVSFKADGYSTPSVNSSDNYVVVFYNNKNYLIDIYKNKVILEFTEENEFCIKDINDNDNSKVILATCKSYDNGYTYKVIEAEKIIFSIDNSTTNTMRYEGDNIVLGSKLLSKNGTEELIIDSKSYQNSQIYAEALSNFEGVNLYQNGNLSKNISCRSIDTVNLGYTEGIYLLSTYFSRACDTTSGLYEFYKSDGTLLVNKTFQKASLFDRLGFAKVSEDKINFYLMDKKGNKISNEYLSISDPVNYSSKKHNHDYYIAKKSDNLQFILDKSGKEIYQGNKLSIENRNNYTMVINKKDDQYIIYDLNQSKELVTLTQEPNFNEHYFTVKENGKTKYYSYVNGHMFYEI